MHPKHERFCREYLIDANAAAAYVRAGYTSNGANKLAARLMAKEDIQQRIAELTAEQHSKLAADANEVITTLTSIMRGEEQQGRKPNVTEMIRAAELLGRRHRLWTEEQRAFLGLVTIVDDIPDTLPAG